MHVLITAVGARTEHWTDLFNSLCARPDVRLTVLASDVSPATRRELDRLGQRHANFHSQVLPHRLGEARTGHMASIMVRGGPPLSPPPDVVHIIGEAAYLSTWQVLRTRRRHWPAVPTTLYAAQNVVTRFPMPFPLLEQYAYREVDMILPITPAARQVLRVKGYRGAATDIPLGVDTTTFRPRAEAGTVRTFTVGFVGRFEPHKGVLDLLRAAELADCDVLLVGDGSLTADIERAARCRPGRIRRHHWAGHAELPDLLTQMSVLALPALEIVQRNVLPWIGIPLREQFGRVLIEAMACGVPVVGSDVGEIPYVIGDAGLVFPAGDPAALADRLIKLRACPETTRDLAAAGLHRATTEFAWDRIADRLVQIWRQLHERSMSVPIPARAGQQVRDNAGRKVVA
ncbi:glycosyltransferase family 4 protein [Verrucosispora sp. WMMD573]|uniref:glycosyltransferase family 4 protein n=1 Tax=Verrucosispora sp. WMMD573 TaxID=3015149 RepID=UPI00248C0417|nr:glycosyltransferase family 4 protein [Verrucosispora sp. WMMD573]WBB53687.1 glycosyltransferase family 4 protein [Verrucosispora sp. WMMD573]